MTAAYSIAWPTISITHDLQPSLWPVLALFAAIPVLLLRRAPFVGWAIALGGCVLWWAATDALPSAPMPWPVMQFLVVLVAVMVVGVRGRWDEVATATGATLLVFLLLLPGTLRGWAVGQAVLVGVALLVRWLVLSRRELAAQTEVVEAERSRRAVVEERGRIARELHDVVAHQMSMIVVQAQSAPIRLQVRDEAVAQEFGVIEDSARRALTEVRSMLGVLREEGRPAQTAPQPDLTQIPALLQQTREAGVDITWVLSLLPDGCPPGSALVLYRVLQESVANAVRHAPGSAVRVSLSQRDGRAVLEVRNGPRSKEAVVVPERAGGAGVDGMRVRVEAVGGDLRIGPDGAGWTVQASVPLAGRPSVAGLG